MQINMLQNKCKDDVVKQSSIFLYLKLHMTTFLNIVIVVFK